MNGSLNKFVCFTVDARLKEYLKELQKDGVNVSALLRRLVAKHREQHEKQMRGGSNE